MYFSNPNTSSIEALKKLCEDAGLNYVGTNRNNRDLRRFSTLKNLGVELGKTASMTGGADLALKQLGAGGIQKVINNGMDALLNGNHLGVAAAMVAGGVIAIGIKNRVKVIAAGIYCTFGKGNQKWYTSDAELLG